MDLVLELLPWLIAMLLLIIVSGFFYASEAAMFSLRAKDRRFLAGGSRTQQLAARLLEDPERLLSAVLFWNLVTIMVYFTIVSIVGFRLDHKLAYGS